MQKSITFVRHAETTANRDGLWQGSIDTPFSEVGRSQLRRLADRLSATDFERVVTSDIQRAVGTAEALDRTFEVDAAWREGSIGSWEGRRFADTAAENPEIFAAMNRGEDVAFGGGETMSEVAGRAVPAFHRLVDGLSDGGNALVVSHGIALLAAISSLFELSRPARLQLMRNTAMTTVVISEYGMHLSTYNDASHLGEPNPARDGDTSLVVFRHGRTQANVESRWQGHGDWPLDDVGTAQAKAAAKAAPPVVALYSSPLQRALATATAIAHEQRLDVQVDDRLKEIGFGSWENLQRSDIVHHDPEGWERFTSGEDIRRGGTGERFVDVRNRMTEAIDEIVAAHPGQRIGIVSHGGATRSYVTGLLGIEFPRHHRLLTMNNTGYATFTYGSRPPVVAEWNIADHLDAVTEP